jgi:hypothetical protein
MSTNPPGGASKRTANQPTAHYLRGALDAAHPADEPFVLNDRESRVIGQTRRQTLWGAVLLGIVGVVVLYGPQYVWPEFFRPNDISFLGQPMAWPLISLLYGLLVLYLGFYALLIINLRAARTIMDVCQFPRQHDARYEQHLQNLHRLAQARNGRGLLQYGLDPYLGLPRWGLSFFFFVNTAKATLTSAGIRSAVGQLAGQQLLPLTDLLALPVYILWNVRATKAVLREAQVRVMAPLTIREFVDELYDEWGKNEQFRSLILDTLAFVMVLNRRYNYAHYLLTETITDRFGIGTYPPEHARPFIELTQHLPADLRRGLERLVIFGILIDGQISYSERRRLRQLTRRGWLTHSIADIRAMRQSYVAGRGLWV